MILKKIVRGQLMEYIKEYNKRRLNQLAIQSLHSTVTCLLNVIEPWLKNSDKGKINLSIFVNPIKALDTVRHKTLLLKLRMHGVEATSYNWFTSYLKNRE